MEQYSRRNNVEISSISNEVSDEHPEVKLKGICKELGIDLMLFNIEECHKLPSGHINTTSNKYIILKPMFCMKKSKSSHISIFATNFLFPYYFFWGKCKKLLRKGLINQVQRCPSVRTCIAWKQVDFANQVKWLVSVQCRRVFPNRLRFFVDFFVFSFD